MPIDSHDTPRTPAQFTDAYAAALAALIPVRCYADSSPRSVADTVTDLTAELIAWRAAGAAQAIAPAPEAADNLRRMFACASRELALRKNVFPKRVADNRMTQQQADSELNAMEMIVALLRAQLQLIQPALI